MIWHTMRLCIILLVSAALFAACSNDPPKSEVQQIEESVAEKEGFTYSPDAQDAGLTILSPSSSSATGNQAFTLKGTVDAAKIKQREILIELKKDGYFWSDVLPVEDGEFTYEIPLFFGKGIHELLIYVPDKEYDNYFQHGTTLSIDNNSDYWDKTRFSSTYNERGIHLELPVGGETNLTYRMSGFINKEAPFAKETTHLLITTSTHEDYAEYIIPVEDYTFDDEFFLRFGPGKYFVTVGVPDIGKTPREPFVYAQVAQFLVDNVADVDLRDRLPSRGIESDAPEIIALANELMNDTMSDREKAKAVYEYTAKTISYNTGKLYFIGNQWDDSALKTLKFKTGMCVDYSYLAIALLRAAGMEARYIVGTAGFGDDLAGHAWVEVKVDGEWLTMDPTWGSGYIDYGSFVPEYTEDYFDPTEDVFSSHVREGVVY